MRLFVSEFITGGGIANDPLPDSLKQEGQLMLQAVLNECSKINDVQLVTTRDSRINISVDNVEVHTVENALDYMQQLALIAAQCDATWVIAPESEGILGTIISHLNKEKITLINCDIKSVRITSDKLSCAQHLIKNGILTAQNLTQEEALAYMQPVIIKYRHSAGCEGLRRCDNGKEALHLIDDFSKWVVQPYLEGNHLSISLLFSNRDVRVISVNEQIIKGERELVLKACHVNAYPVNENIKILANKILNAFPGLKGYVGIDLIDVRGDYYIIDINPRLTSSFVGLSGVLEDNPAELCLKSVINSELPNEIKINNRVVEVKVA